MSKKNFKAMARDSHNTVRGTEVETSKKYIVFCKTPFFTVKTLFEGEDALERAKTLVNKNYATGKKHNLSCMNWVEEVA